MNADLVHVSHAGADLRRMEYQHQQGWGAPMGGQPMMGGQLMGGHPMMGQPMGQPMMGPQFQGHHPSIGMGMGIGDWRGSAGQKNAVGSNKSIRFVKRLGEGVFGEVRNHFAFLVH